MNILVVDDAGFIRHFLTNIITEIGHHVVGYALNGREAVDMAARLAPDVIIMDLVLPEQNGLEAAIEILKQNPDAKLIACSSLDTSWVEQKTKDAGFIYFIKKPFKKADVEIALRSVTKSERGLQHG